METNSPCFSCCTSWVLIQAKCSLFHLSSALVILGLTTKVTLLLPGVHSLGPGQYCPQFQGCGATAATITDQKDQWCWIVLQTFQSQSRERETVKNCESHKSFGSWDLGIIQNGPKLRKTDDMTYSLGNMWLIQKPFSVISQYSQPHCTFWRAWVLWDVTWLNILLLLACSFLFLLFYFKPNTSLV